MVKKDFYSTFIGKNSVQKTLRNELVPIGKTIFNIEKYGIITEDETRSEKYKQAKKIIDEYHRYFIEKSLIDFKYDFTGYFKLILECRKSGNEEQKKLLKEKQNEIRSEITKCFTKSNKYKKMFKKELITELLPSFIHNDDTLTEEEKDEKLEVLTWFNSFSTYFTNFHKNRENVYSAEEKVTAVSYRVVNENAGIFLDNMLSYEKAVKDIGADIAAIDELNSELLDGWTISQIFNEDYYSFLLIQKSIEYYNNVCAVFNSFINEICQKRKLDKRSYKMKKLHKQILSLSSTIFEIPGKFEDDDQVYDTVNEFIEMLNANNVMTRIHKLFKEVNDYCMDKIYIEGKSLTEVSKVVYGDWSVIRECLIQKYNDIVPGQGEKKNEKVVAIVNGIKYLSLADIDEVVNKYLPSDYDKDVKGIQHYFNYIAQRVEGIELKAIEKDDKKLVENDIKIDEFKTALDTLEEVLRLLKVFVSDDDMDIDSNFKNEYVDVYADIINVVPIYNKVRNYVTQKPYSEEKFKLNFTIPTLADGWDKNKEYSNNTMIFIRDGLYYLGIYNAKNKPAKTALDGTKEMKCNSDYKKMVYKLLPGPNKMLPKVFLSKKGIETYNPSKYILDGYAEGKHKKGERNFDIQFCHDLIDYFKDSIDRHPDWKEFGFKFTNTKEYSDISEFYKEVSEQGYKITFEYISEDVINKLIDDEKLFFFQIKNKDFAPGKKGKDNLHTMYWKNIFSDENLKDVVIKLNGQAELFFRRASIKNPYVHKKGEILVNKRTKNGNIIPDSMYKEISDYVNGKIDTLSSEAELIYPSIASYECTMDLVKNKRFTENKFFFHVPITINYKAQGREKIDDIAQMYIANNIKEMHFIGIDRGERNLVYVSVIDNVGNIKCQKSFNIINDYDYQEKLVQKEKARNESRVNWKEVGKIKQLKEGYLSLVIHEITKLMLEYNAIIIMENLNAGFKNSRKKVERQVYQKFEKMLIDKLIYLVSKDKKVDEPGGVLRGYQLTRPVEKMDMVGKQCGMIFYVPPGYTSQIDPTTGFVNVFRFKKYSSVKAKKEFLLNMDKIAYDSEKDMFYFEFDYANYDNLSQKLPRTNWKAYTHGERIVKKYSKQTGMYQEEKAPMILTEVMKKVLEDKGIEYKDGHNLLTDINELNERQDAEIIKEIFNVFETTLQMRNSRTNDVNYDKIISPVLNDRNEYFETSGNDTDELPSNADANGAYNIALKGLFIAKKIADNWKKGEKLSKDVLGITNSEWFEFVQNR